MPKQSFAEISQVVKHFFLNPKHINKVNYFVSVTQQLHRDRGKNGNLEKDKFETCAVNTDKNHISDI